VDFVNEDSKNGTSTALHRRLILNLPVSYNLTHCKSKKILQKARQLQFQRLSQVQPEPCAPFNLGGLVSFKENT
jgi:hypothetical protein